MAYTNDMRHAIHALKNPTPLAIDVSIKDDMIYLLVSGKNLSRLNKKQKSDFNAYLNEIKSIIRIGGGGDAQVVVLQ